MKRIVKLYKPKEGEPFPYKVIDDGRGRVFFFRTNKEKEKYRKEQEERDWQKYREWEEKTNKKCYQRFLKEFKVSPSKEKEIFPLETLKYLMESRFFLQFYVDPLIDSISKDGVIKLGGKHLAPKEREEFSATLLKKFIELEAKKYAALYKLDWQDLYQEFEIKLMKERGKYDPNRTASLLTYYQKIIRNRVMELVRKKSRPLLSIENIKQEQYKESVSVIDVDILDFRLSLNKLTPKQQEAIKLVSLEGLPIKEAAEQFGISIDSLKDRINGAMKKLKELLKP